MENKDNVVNVDFANVEASTETVEVAADTNVVTEGASEPVDTTTAPETVTPAPVPQRTVNIEDPAKVEEIRTAVVGDLRYLADKLEKADPQTLANYLVMRDGLIAGLQGAAANGSLNEGLGNMVAIAGRKQSRISFIIDIDDTRENADDPSVETPYSIK